MRRLAALATLVALGLATAACARGDRPAGDDAPLLVFAASDLRDALGELARAHRAAGGDSLVLVFGSTGDLAAQVAAGAPADLLFAANAQAIDALAAQGLIVDSTRAVYAEGRLALVAACDTAARERRPCRAPMLAELASPAVRTVAIADPAHAPYGMAARQALERAGLWDAVRPKLVLGANVSQAEQFVATGNADAGIVALSLVLRTPGRPHDVVDASLHDPLRQTVAVLAASRRADAAGRFLAHLRSPGGQSVMHRYGFTTPSP